MPSLDLVHKYFDRQADRFDAIYERDKPLMQQVGDAVFRRVILERYALVMNAVGASGHSFLDIGCGPGRYGIELARRGAPRCVGVDVAAPMIDLARRESERHDVADRCEWHVADWMSFELPEPFDAAAAMGYFDYVEEPDEHLAKMIAAIPKGRLFASFPKRFELRVPLRLARFKMENGFVRFYSKPDVLNLFRSVGSVASLSLVDLGRDYVAIYDVGAQSRR